MIKLLSTRFRQFRSHPDYVLLIVGSVFGYLVGSIEGAVLGAVMGFFVGKTIQSLVWTLGSE